MLGPSPATEILLISQRLCPLFSEATAIQLPPGQHLDRFSRTWKKKVEDAHPVTTYNLKNAAKKINYRSRNRSVADILLSVYKDLCLIPVAGNNMRFKE